jgi:transcription elongation factor Elf1
MLTCPRCDGQGSVLKAKIIKTNELIFICDECDATWFSLDAVSYQPWVDFGTYMERKNLSSAWNELKILGDAVP